MNPSVTHAINSMFPGLFRYWSQFSKDDLPHPAWEGTAWNWWNSDLQKYNRQQWFLMPHCLCKEKGGTSQCKPEAQVRNRGKQARKRKRKAYWRLMWPYFGGQRRGECGRAQPLSGRAMTKPRPSDLAIYITAPEIVMLDSTNLFKENASSLFG